MSRHRHIRNLRLDDYDDGYDDYDDYDDYEEDDYNNQYNYNQQQQSQENQPSDDLLEDVVRQFRQLLNDDTIPEQVIDIALQEADYDFENALNNLKEQRRIEEQKAIERLSQLEKTDPSPIAKMFDETTQNQSQRLQLPKTNPERIPSFESFNNYHGGEFVTRETWESPSVEPFAFDTPSPDDIALAKQRRGVARAQAVRLPKASELRAMNNKSNTPNQAGSSSKQNNDQSTAVKPKKPLAGSSKDAENRFRRREEERKERNQRNREKREEKVTVPKVIKQRTKKVDLTAVKKASTSSVSIVVAGHVDAGKSTLVGHLLQQLQNASAAGEPRRHKKQQDLAWSTDEDKLERERGITIDIATRTFQIPRSDDRTYALIDSPGHRDFVPAMILGASQASAAILVVDASPGEFEAGFSELGQTREHALVLKSLGVTRLIVVVNKMEVIDFAKDRFMKIKSMLQTFLFARGWNGKDAVTFIPASGREGVNLLNGPKQAEHPLRKWYKGNSLVKEIESIRSVSENEISNVSSKPTRLVISDFFRSASLGGVAAVTGRLVCGSIAPKDVLTLCPGGVNVSVKSVELISGQRVNAAIAGLHSLPVSMGLQDLPDGTMVATGNVLCNPENLISVATKFQAQIIVTAADALLLPGTQGVIHIGGGAEEASIERLCRLILKKNAGSSKPKVPRRMISGEKGEVVFQMPRGVAMEKSEDVKGLGRLVFRQDGRTLAVGIVLRVLETE